MTDAPGGNRLAATPRTEDAPSWVRLLAEGHWREGWPACVRALRPPEGWPLDFWEGQPPPLRLHLHPGRMGFGDEIAFSRFARMLAERGYTVSLESAPSLVSLFRDSFGDVPVTVRGQRPPAYDRQSRHCEILFVIAHAGLDLDTCHRHRTSRPTRRWWHTISDWSRMMPWGCAAFLALETCSLLWSDRSTQGRCCRLPNVSRASTCLSARSGRRSSRYAA